MITLENVSYSVGSKTLIQEASLQFERGKMHLILGPNGAGKSTLVKLMSGELLPDTGTVLFDQEKLNKVPLPEQAKRRAVLSQNLELSFPLEVQEVVAMGRYPHFKSKPTTLDAQVCQEAMELFGVSGMKSRNYLTLSGGEKQRVQFARVFAQIWTAAAGKDRLLLLDEPLTFLDIFYQYDLMQKIKSFMQHHPDLTVIGVVHDLNIAAKFADKVLLLKDKEIVGYGNPEEVLTEKAILEVFRMVVEDRFIVK